MLHYDSSPAKPDEVGFHFEDERFIPGERFELQGQEYAHLPQDGLVPAWAHHDRPRRHRAPQRRRHRRVHPAGSDARDGFDAIGVVVDWIDACKQRRLDDLLNLYDATATVECCEGGSFRGR